MKHITLAANKTGGIIFDVGELATRLDKLPDTRDSRGKIYPLGMILTLVLLAKLCGEDKPSGMAEWIRLRRDVLVKLFNCKHQRVPCLNIIRWVLQEIVSIEELERTFTRYLHETYGGWHSRLVAIDGKTMRGTIAKSGSQGVHLLAAYLPVEGIVLQQIEVGAKSNEISVAPQLVQGLNLKNKVVCGDAMHTQRSLSVDILAQGGEYLWFLKDNQPTALADVEQFFHPPQKSAGFPLTEIPCTVAHTTDKGHGRLEQRTLTLKADDEMFLDWPGVRQVFRLERQVLNLRTGITSAEVVHGITSCNPNTASAEQLLTWTRHYWGIENGLHYRRDVTLREDATRISQPALARSIAVINNFIVGLTQKLGFSNLASARRTFSASIAAQLAALPDY
jgi:predicted transposase YbfD/YdcC